MVVQYLLIALVAFIASMDEQLFGITMLGRPLFTSLFVGLILGDVQQGVIVGAALESMFMGAIMVGAAVPPEVYASGVLGCAFAVITGTGTATAVALALPVSVFLQVWRNFSTPFRVPLPVRRLRPLWQIAILPRRICTI